MIFLVLLMTHNLTRELQMQTNPRMRITKPERLALWVFEKLETLRNRMVKRVGRFNRPAGQLTLTLSQNEAVLKGYAGINWGQRKAA